MIQPIPNIILVLFFLIIHHLRVPNDRSRYAWHKELPNRFSSLIQRLACPLWWPVVRVKAEMAVHGSRCHVFVAARDGRDRASNGWMSFSREFFGRGEKKNLCNCTTDDHFACPEHIVGRRRLRQILDWDRRWRKRDLGRRSGMLTVPSLQRPIVGWHQFSQSSSSLLPVVASYEYHNGVYYQMRCPSRNE